MYTPPDQQQQRQLLTVAGEPKSTDEIQQLVARDQRSAHAPVSVGRVQSACTSSKICIDYSLRRLIKNAQRRRTHTKHAALRDR